MSKQNDKWLATYAHFILDSETRRIYEGDFIQYFGSKDVYMFKYISNQLLIST
jgi:hypothetical protein